MNFCIATPPSQRCDECGACDWRSTREADVVCASCGLVVESRVMCDLPDVKHYEDGDDAQPSRLCEAVYGHATESARLGHISDRRLDRLQRFAARRSTSSSSIKGVDVAAFERATVSLSLPDSTVRHARAIWQSMSEKLRPRGMRGVVAAMCTYFACKDIQGNFRTVDQVCQAFGVEACAFLKLYNDFGQHAHGQPWFDPVKHDQATDLLPLVLSVLGIYKPKLRVQIANKVKALYDMPVLRGKLGHRDTGGVVGALLWVGCSAQLPVSKKALTEACGVKYTTINTNIEIIQAELRRRATSTRAAAC